MKLFVKVTVLLMALVMLLSVATACKDEKTSPVNEAEKAYNALKTDVEKLFHVVETEHPTVTKLASPLGVSFKRTENETKINKEAEFNFSLDELQLNGEDKLSALGSSPFTLTGKVLTGEEGNNLSISGTYSGMKVEAQLRADDNGVMISCPVAFNKPYYVPDAAVDEVFASLFSKYTDVNLGEFDVNTVQVSSEWAKENLTEEKCKHLFELFKDVLPTNDVASEEVVVPELKGDYITEDTKAECITLKLDTKAYDRFITNFSNNYLIDATFKALVISYVDALIDNGCIDVEAGYDGNKAFTELSKRIKDYVKEFDTEKDKVTVTAKRYFVKGFDVKLDVIVSKNGDTVADASCWNYYTDTARQFGANLSLKGEKIFSLAGGANETDADTAISLQTYKEDVVVEDGVADTQRVKGDEIKVNLEVRGQNFKAKLTKGGKEIASYVLNTQGEKTTVDAKVEVDFSDNKLTVAFNSVKTKNNEGKFDSTLKFNAEAEGILKLSGKLSAKINPESTASIQHTTQEGSYAINGKHDLNYVDKNFTPVFDFLFGSKGEDKPAEDVVEDSSEISEESTEENTDTTEDTTEASSVITVDVSVSE